MEAPPLELNTVPESLLKKRKRDEQWALERKEKLEQTRAKKKNRKITFKRAEQYLKEYRQQELDFVRLKRETKKKGGFYVEPEAKLIFVIRLRGINDIHPKTRKILQLLRLRQIFNGVFLNVNEATMSMLKKVEPYVTYGYPNLKSVRELIFKRGYGKVDNNRLPLTDNAVIEDCLGKFGIICLEDLVHEIHNVGPHFKEANNFLWPFKLSSPSTSGNKKHSHLIERSETGNREDKVNALICQMT